MDNHYTVYVHISPMGLRYYGITGRDVKVRWNNGNGYIHNKHFYRAIQKYGWDAFRHEMVAEGLTKQEACRIEEMLIDKYHTQDPRYGYNLSAGGEHNWHSQAAKDKVSVANKGRKVSDETRRKLSEAHMGHPSALKGRSLSDEHKAKIAASLIGKPHPKRTPESRMRRVVCDGTEYDSIQSCAKAYGVRQDMMSRWLSGDAPVPEKFVDGGLSYVDTKVFYELVNDVNHRVVSYEARAYQTVNECAEHIGVDRHTVSRWLNGKIKMPAYIIAGELHYVDTYHYVAKKQ